MTKLFRSAILKQKMYLFESHSHMQLRLCFWCRVWLLCCRTWSCWKRCSDNWGPS